MREALAHIISAFSVTECEFSHSVPLARLTTFRIGGPADVVAVPKTKEIFSRLLSMLADAGIPRVILGNGSNVLASDSGYRGVVIRTVALRSLSYHEGDIIADCGVPLSAIASLANENGIAGFSALASIPATLGGAICMNAGAADDTVGAAVKSVCVVPSSGGAPFLMQRDECGFSYRKSIFLRRHLVVLSATLGGPHQKREKLLSDTAAARERRRATQPLEQPSAGSAFRRPPQDYAGRLIEAAGLKGYRIGDAAISEKHAGFVVNLGDATSRDVKKLLAHVRLCVYERFGVCLMREIEYLGEE